MKWIHQYQLFLFDFDGLLVNTEELHYLAYKNMLRARGFEFPWDFNRYCQTAHYNAHGLQEEIFSMFPDLYKQEPSWDILYGEKKKALIRLLDQGTADLMPGVAELLQSIKAAKIKSCVVTHSPDELVGVIRKQHPLLNTISFWITRHDYTHPKPHPECYFRAIEKYGLPDDLIVGFEDTPRGLKALMETRAKPVLICQANYPEIPAFKQQGVLHYKTFRDILMDQMG